MNNYEIADQFTLLSKLMDIHGENSFKSKSYSVAAYNIERLPAEANTMTDAILYAQKGIGESTGKKIRELLTTGQMKALVDIIAKTPSGILDMLQIKGLGPKKIAVIWQELGIESLGELEYACNENRLVTLKGFGAKTQESVLQNIVYFNQNIGFCLWADAEKIAASFLQFIAKVLPDVKTEPTGALRRQCETMEEIAFVTTATAEQLSAIIDKVDGADIVNNGDSTDIKLPGQSTIRCYHTDTDNFYNKLFITTGCDDFVNAFIAKYGMPQSAISEASIFEKAGIAYINPAMRESADLVQLQQTANNKLILPSDIKGIIHSHSTWSDGVNTIAEMAKAAIEAGLEYLVISDHSQSAVYAGGLKPEAIAAQHAEIDLLNTQLAPFRIFKSIESDILGDGSLDYSSSVLATFDLVIASVHSNLKMTEEKAMERLLTAIRNPYTTILGHPTGRLLLSRKGYPLDHKAIIDECAERGVVIEINAHPRRLDIDWRWISYAMEKGVLLSINPDAHSVDGYHDTYYGVMVAQKAGLTAHHNLSSYNLEAFTKLIEHKKAKILS